MLKATTRNYAIGMRVCKGVHARRVQRDGVHYLAPQCVRNLYRPVQRTADKTHLRYRGDLRHACHIRKSPDQSSYVSFVPQHTSFVNLTHKYLREH